MVLRRLLPFFRLNEGFGRALPIKPAPTNEGVTNQLEWLIVQLYIHIFTILRWRTLY